MRVYIIGAGPGDPKLITVRGAELIAACPVVLYTGSLVPAEVVARASKDATVLDSSGMTLDEILAILVRARDAGQDVARVHTGDPLIFGSTAEQIRKLEELGIEYEIIPGVSSFSAAAAALRKELTLPELSQTVILTRAEGRTPMPDAEKLEQLAQHRATLCLFLEHHAPPRRDRRRSSPPTAPTRPVAVVHKASCPDQVIVLGTLGDIREKVRAVGLKSQSMILVGHVLTSTSFANSKLYDPEFSHGYRRAVKPQVQGDMTVGRVASRRRGSGRSVAAHAASRGAAAHGRRRRVRRARVRVDPGADPRDRRTRPGRAPRGEGSSRLPHSPRRDRTGLSRPLRRSPQGGRPARLRARRRGSAGARRAGRSRSRSSPASRRRSARRRTAASR